MKKRVLCYGDSNTWGYIPGQGLRYEEDVRWTGVCQAALGPGYQIIEEGLSGRTTVFDIPWAQCRNGLSGLGYALQAQAPLDLAIICLGTNDLVMKETRHIALGADKLVRVTLNADRIFDPPQPIFPEKPRVLLVAPAPFHPVVEQRPDSPAHGKYQASRQLAALYREIAAARGVDFLDAGQYARPSEVDGVHLTPESHARLGRAMAQTIRAILAPA